MKTPFNNISNYCGTKHKDTKIQWIKGKKYELVYSTKGKGGLRNGN